MRGSTASRSRSSKGRRRTCCCRAPAAPCSRSTSSSRSTASAGTESIALPASPSPISRVALVLPKSGVDLSVDRRLHRRPRRDGRRKPMDGIRPSEPAADRCRGSARSTIGAPSCRCACARALTSVVGLGEDACQVTAAVRVEVLQGLAREVTLALPAGLVVNQVNGATVGDWESGRRHAASAAARAGRHRDLLRRAGRHAGAARRPDRRAARADAVRRARDRRGGRRRRRRRRDRRASGARTRTGRSVRARRRRRRPRVAVDDRVSSRSRSPAPSRARSP